MYAIIVSNLIVCSKNYILPKSELSNNTLAWDPCAKLSQQQSLVQEELLSLSMRTRREASAKSKRWRHPIISGNIFLKINKTNASDKLFKSNSLIPPKLLDYHPQSMAAKLPITRTTAWDCRTALSMPQPSGRTNPKSYGSHRTESNHRLNVRYAYTRTKITIIVVFEFLSTPAEMWVVYPLIFIKDFHD